MSKDFWEIYYKYKKNSNFKVDPQRNEVDPFKVKPVAGL